MASSLDVNNSKYPAWTKWMLMLSLVLHGLVAQFIQLQAKAIPYETATFFQISVTKSNNLYVTVQLIDLIGAFLILCLMAHYGPTCIYYAMQVFSIVMVGIRVYSFSRDPTTSTNPNIYDENFILFAISSLLAVVCNSCTVILQLQLTNLWIPVEKRTITMSMCLLGKSVISLLIIFSISPAIINGTHNTYLDFLNLGFVILGFLLLTILSSVLFLWKANWTCLPIDEYPSNSSKEISESYQNKDYGSGFGQNLVIFLKSAWETIKEGAKLMLDFRGFLIIFLLLGYIYAIGSVTIISYRQILCPFGYSKYYSTVGMIGIYLAGSFILSFFTSYLYDKIGLKCIYVVLLILHIVSFGQWFSLFFMEKNYLVQTIVTLLFGIGFTSMPILFELSADITYPANQATVNGLINIANCIFTATVGYLFYNLGVEITDPEELEGNTCNIDEDSGNYPINYKWVMLGLKIGIAVTSALVVFMKVDFKRSKLDKNQNYENLEEK